MRESSPLYVFYSWNEAQDDGELVRQMREFSDKGITGVFIHARAGLSIPYFGDEWFGKIALCIKEAKSLKMEIGLYDENGWPSGFGGGKVNGLGRDFQQKKLAFSSQKPSGENIRILAVFVKTDCGYEKTGAERGDLYAYVEYNPTYVDVLSPRVTEEFISLVHEEYRRRFGREFGKTIKYMFTDEPQLAAPLAYTDGIEDIFYKEYGYDISGELWRLYADPDVFSRVRRDYRALCSKLFHENYTRKIGEWCGRYGLGFTGHFACEESPVTLNINGGAQNGYEYMQVPGVDALGRRRPPSQLFEQLISAKNFFGKKYALSETFGCAGWSTSLSDFSYLWANQTARGVNFPCLHLSPYSIRGIRKRDYPAFFGYQAAWWNDFGALAKRMKTAADFVGGPRFSDVLILYPEYGSTGLYPECRTDRELAKRYSSLIEQAENNQVAFDIANDGIFSRAEIRGGEIKLSDRRYKTVIAASSPDYPDKTLELLAKAVSSGVNVCFYEPFPEMLAKIGKTGADETADLRDYLWKIRYRRKAAAFGPDFIPDGNVYVRSFGDDSVIFFNKDVSAARRVTLYVSDAESLEVLSADGSEMESLRLDGGYAEITLPPRLLLLAKKSGKKQSSEKSVIGCEKIPPSRIERRDPNVLVIDKARFGLSGGAFSEEMYALEIEEALASAESGTARVRYRFFAEFVPNDLRIAAEKGAVKVALNGKELTPENGAYYIDKCIKVYPAADCAKVGENEIELTFEMRGSSSVSALDSENEIDRNLFSFATEVENVYVLGSFGVCAGGFTRRGDVLCVKDGEFTLTRPERIEAGELTRQGLWFYRGAIEVKYFVPVANTGEKLCLHLAGGGQSSALVEETNTVLLDWLDSCDVTAFSGKEITLRLTVSDRNLLGPHHHVLGDPTVVGGNTYRGVRGFEDEWLPSRHLSSTHTDEYNFVACELPEITVCRIAENKT